jgi:hypothetical protein
MSEARRCTKCREVKPLEAFALHPQGKNGRRAICKECQAADMREARKDETPAERNARMAAYRAGMRKDKCAVCGGAVEGHGICFHCQEHIRMLGGLDGLKRAVKAVKYLAEQ